MPDKLSQKYKSEHHLQCICINWFDLYYPKLRLNLFAIPNGGLRNKMVAKKLKKEGARSGVWDLFLSLPNATNNGLYIESKNGDNCLTDNQIIFKSANDNNYSFAVIRSLDEFQMVLKSYMNNEEF